MCNLQIPTRVKCPGCSDRKNMPPWTHGAMVGVRALNGAVTKKPHEARSFVWGKGPCGSTKPVVALGDGVVRRVACSAALASPPRCTEIVQGTMIIM